MVCQGRKIEMFVSLLGRKTMNGESFGLLKEIDNVIFTVDHFEAAFV